MKKEHFKKLVKLIQKQMKLSNYIYDNLHIDIVESELFTIPGELFDVAVISGFTEEGQDFVFWWVYEDITDKYLIEDDKRIDVNSIDDFWDFLVSRNYVL